MASMGPVRLFTDRRMLDHQPPTGHPEKPQRLSSVLRHLERTTLIDSCPQGTVREATEEELRRVHSLEYLDRLAHLSRQAGQGSRIEPDTWLGPGSLQAAKLSAGSAIEAVQSVIAGPQRRSFCAVRPPGHHARPAQAMGFCLISTAAVAAAEAVKGQGVDRVLVVDFDVHHGNGTQEIFYDNPNVAFLSIHRHPFYPGTGSAEETGSGKGLGLTTNLPIRYGTARNLILDAFRNALESMADRYQPQIVILSAGFDAHAEDPVGDLGLETEDFEALTRSVMHIAETHAEGRLVSLLEGGYNPSILAGCVEAHLRTLGAEST